MFWYLKDGLMDELYRKNEKNTTTEHGWLVIGALGEQHLDFMEYL